MRSAWIALVVGTVGCSSSEPAPQPATPVATAARPVDAAPMPPPTPPGPVPIDAAVIPPPQMPDAAPAVLVPKKAWPFHEWDRAEAVSFNQVPYGPGIPLLAYSADAGWNPQIAERKPIDAAQAKRAADWTIATTGDVEVSKCAFPRHAVVFYAGDTPVGTTNVCFECGDILVWPAYEPGPDYDNFTDAEEKKWEKKYKKKLAAYKKVFPQWEKFFGTELAFSLTPPPRP